MVILVTICFGFVAASVALHLVDWDALILG
jgi:hypothetical protein